MTAVQLQLPASAVTVNMSGITTGTSRRLLLSTSVVVPFTAAVINATAATAVSSGLASIDPAGFASSFNAALASAGVTGISVSLLSTFSVAGVALPPSPPVNLTAAGGNVSAAVASVTQQLAGATGATLVAAQTSMLAGLTGSTTSQGNGTTLSSSAASTAAALVLAVVSASPNASLSPAVQSSALSVLGAVSSSPSILNDSVSTTVAAGVLAVVSSAQNASLSPAVQSAALSVLGAVSSSPSTLGSSVASTVAAGVFSVVNGSSSISATVQTAALNVLSAVASAPINVSGAAGGAVVNALSTIASSASSNNPSALAQVSTVTSALAANAASSLLSTSSGGNSTVSISFPFTPNIQMAISVTPPGVVSTTPISAPGSPSSFDAMPPGLLASAAGGGATAAVITQFRSLSFDPYSNTTNGTAPASTLSIVGGVTRLAFSTAAGPLEVANATTPITFTLPAVPTNGTNKQAACSFYDTVAQTYSTAGCIGVPNPGPPNHTLAFVPGYQTPSDASLALAWSITGPLLAGCNSTVIDCSLPDPPVIYPDPRQPLAIPAVSCPVNATKPPVLRVFYGTHCQLWQPGNAYNCSWNNTLQAFNGTGCAATGNVTKCMCRHLTDFAAARTPKLTTCSLSDLLSLNPADIVTKLKFLFIVRSFRPPGFSAPRADLSPCARSLSRWS